MQAQKSLKRLSAKPGLVVTAICCLAVTSACDQGTGEDEAIEPGDATPEQPTATETETVEPSPTDEGTSSPEGEEDGDRTNETEVDEPEGEREAEDSDGEFVEPELFSDSPYASGGVEGQRGILDDIEIGEHGEYDRIVFHFFDDPSKGIGVPAWEAVPDGGSSEITITFNYTALDENAAVDGEEINFGSGMLILDSYRPNDDPPIQDPEMEVTALLDYSAEEHEAFRVFELEDPARIVVDAQRFE